MASSQRPTSASAFTLIEVLSVVVLVGLIAGALAPNLARRSRSAQLERFKSGLIEFDALARQLALKGGRVSVRYETDDEAVRLFEQRERPMEIRSLPVPDTIQLHPIGFDSAVVFDANGCTRGYGYMIQADSAVHRLAFHGVSGWYEVTRDDR